MTTIDPQHTPTQGWTQFQCPQCNVVAQQEWSDVALILPKQPNHPGSFPINHKLTPAQALKISCCYVCKKLTVWMEGQILWPSPNQISAPSSDMPENVKTNYEEARLVYNHSPRSAAALLRLAIQHLCVDLGGGGKNINEDIGKLVKDGLPEKVQQALDVVRVIGNNAVHPGVISIDDNPEVVAVLFKLVNMIVDDMITQPKEVAGMFNSLPTGAKDAIQKRDA
jgi:hypothetical protein